MDLVQVFDRATLKAALRSFPNAIFIQDKTYEGGEVTLSRWGLQGKVFVIVQEQDFADLLGSFFPGAEVHVENFGDGVEAFVFNTGMFLLEVAQLLFLRLPRLQPMVLTSVMA